jgi:RHS repeat-associated protein
VNGTLTRGWLYQDGLKPVAELDGAGNVVSRFVYGGKANVPEYLVKNGAEYRLITDQLGSVRLVVNAADGSIAQRLDYDEFGRVLNDSNPGFQPFGYAGGLYDPDTGLVRFGARDYDADAGRWMSKDPIGFDGGDNWYAYVGNNPVNKIDPLGLYNPISGPNGPVGSGSGLADPSVFFPLPTPNNSAAGNGGGTFDLPLTLGTLGLSQSIVQFGSGNATVAENGSLYLSGLFGRRGFNGNQWLATAKISKCAERIAPPIALASIAADAFDPDVSWGKTGVNAGFTGIGFVAPPYGAIVAGSYFLIDNTYPGGLPSYTENVWEQMGDALYGSGEGP